MTARSAVFPAENTFFTSDLHVSHKLIARLRGFGDDLDAHDDAILDAWNTAVPKNSNVIMLGDVSFRRVPASVEFFARLNGSKFVVPGNHDRTADLETIFGANHVLPPLFRIDLSVTNQARADRAKVTVCHFPLAAWDGSDHGRPHLHGHLHTGLTDDPPHPITDHLFPAVRRDVGVDNAAALFGLPRFSPIPSLLAVSPEL